MELCEAAKRRAETAASAEGELEEAQCIAALDQLHKSSITCQLLVSTQVLCYSLSICILSLLVMSCMLGSMFSPCI